MNKEWENRLTVGTFALCAALVLGGAYYPVIKEIRRQSKEANKEAMLIAQKGEMTKDGYVGAMFFSTDGKANTTNMMAQFTLDSVRQIELVRNMPTGTIRKIRDWEWILTDRKKQECYWRQLER